MIEVSALTSGKHAPASRYRVYQHVSPLRERGIEVREFAPAIQKYATIRGWPSTVSTRYAPHYYLLLAAKLGTRLPGFLDSWRSDITWLERELVPGLPTIERWLRKPLVFDVDDAIWLARPFGEAAAAQAAARAAVVLAGNDYLAEWFSARGANVHIVHTAVDTDQFTPAADRRARERERFVICWSGSSGSILYLEQMDAVIAEILAKLPRAELLVVSNDPPRFSSVPPERVRFIQWSPASEASALDDADVGIMPLPDDEWTRGKCSLKMLQYMSSAIPVVVAPVGLNAQILGMAEVGLPAQSPSGWLDAISHFYHDRVHARACGEAGRRVVEEHFSRAVVTEQLVGIFSNLVA